MSLTGLIPEIEHSKDHGMVLLPACSSYAMANSLDSRTGDKPTMPTLRLDNDAYERARMEVGVP
jgi:hypothetical protein